MSTIPSPLNLKEIFRRVYALERDRVDLAYRRACLLVAQDYRASWYDLTETERETLRSVDNRGKPLDVILSDQRLGSPVRVKYEDARMEILNEEALRLGRSPFKKTAFLVMCQAFMDGVNRVVSEYQGGGDAVGWQDTFRMFCERLLTPGGASVADADGPFEKLDDELWARWHVWYTELETAGLADELLERLRNECPEECRAMKPRIPLGEKPETATDGAGQDHETQAVVPKRPSDNAFKAWRLRDITGLKSQPEIADAMSQQLGRKVHQGEVSRWLGDVGAYLKAGNIFPDLPALTSKPQSIDPNLIDMGERQDHRTQRQRKRRDPDAK